MRHHRGIQTLIRLLPFRSRWSGRLRQHLESCRKCQEDLADLEEARAATISSVELGQGKDFWPDLAIRIESVEPQISARPRLNWRWALGAAGFVAVAAAVGLFLFQPGSGNDPVSAVRLRINYVTMYEKPAHAFIFQTQDPNSTFVWVEKQNSGETL